MVNHIKILSTDIKNPWINLALEEYFLVNQKPGEATLFLWQNKDTVVIGRNQNPWTECNIPLMEEDNIRLARRITGGGAVFHDIGNLNFSFILNRDTYDVKRQCGIIINALKGLDIDAEISGRNDIVADGKKFSGNAFCFRGMNGLHHGTILISADKERMVQYLTVSADKIKAKGVTSVKSRVINLCDIEPGLTPEIIKEAVTKAFQNEYGVEGELIHYSEMDKSLWPDDPFFRDIITRNSSWEWNFGETPEFDAKIKNRFSWGGIELYFKLDGGVIDKADVYSDALCEELIAELPAIFKGTRLNGSELANRLREREPLIYNDLAKDKESVKPVINDLASWLINEF